MVIFLLLFLSSLFGEEPKIEFWFENSEGQEEMPMQANFIITHEASDPIDPQSFRFDQKKITPSLLAKKKIGPTLLVETYQFSLSPLAAGEYPFQGLQARVGGTLLQSSPVTLTVKPLEKGKTLQTQEAFLEITPILEMPPKLYSGMEITLGYRYRFRGAILLKEEVIPLIDNNPFEKRGDKEIEDGQEGSTSTRTIRQKFQVVQPLVYSIPESRIAGYTYTEGYDGRKILAEPKLESVIPPFTIAVLPFPEKGKPPFFDGILGPFSIESKLLTPPTVDAGESLRYQISFTGKGESQTLKGPNLHCQPGFAYLFSLASSSPERDKDSFTYELSARQAGAIAIPEVIVATFIPSEEKYEIIHTAPIPIQVAAPPVSTISSQEKAVPVTMKRPPFVPPPPLEFEESMALASQFYEKGYPEEALFLLRREYKKRPFSLSLKREIQEISAESAFPFPWSNLYWNSLYFIVFLLWFAALLLAYFRKWRVFLAVGAFSLLLYGAVFYFSPIEGQLLRPSYLYKLPHRLSPKVDSSPVAGGSEVEVLEVLSEGKWLKIRDRQGRIGFVPYETMLLFN